jgi:membrane-bound lytic murein transglycosylase D
MMRILRTLQHLVVFRALAVSLAGALWLSATLTPPTARAEAAHAMDLPRPEALAADVHFWVRIYSEVTTSGGLIHDSRHLEVVYDSVTIPTGLSRRAKERWTDKVKSKYSKILGTLSKGKRTGLTGEEARILSLWPDDVSNKELRAAKSRLRFQLGQADKFRAGIVRSGRWNDHIEKIIADHDLPYELAALPHVESSFTPWAYSRVGAAGLWQFTRSTGRRFLRVDHVVDERLDPYRATVAAARLLKQNREVTGSWPLAITAYNHGASGMRRAVRKMGTSDITTINRKYKSRTFGFASRNFYVELLAASEVSSNYLTYFGPLVLDTPIEYSNFEVPFYVKPTSLMTALGIDRATFEKANPSLRPAVWRGAKHIPRNFNLRVPQSALAIHPATAIESIPKAERHAAQTRDLDYRVRRGDSLSTIARRFKVSVSELVAINGLRSRHKIRVGQKIKLPNGSHGAAPSRRSPSIASGTIPASGRYTVRRGDTISRIATRFGIDEAKILDANQLKSRHRIYVGQTLALNKAAAKTKANTKANTKTNTKTKTSKPVPSKPKRTETAAKPSSPSQPHPDAQATLSNPPNRPSEAFEPIQGGVLVAAVEEPAPGEMSSLLADPSDYGVARDDTIEVQGTETLGHYAEWLGIRASRLRRINDMDYGRAISIGQRIRLDFSSVDSSEFETRRQDYHRGLQEAFFERYEIEGTRTHVARRGDSVWTLAQKKYRVPLWLLRQYNPDLDFAALQKGTQIQVPELKERENWLPAKVVDRRAG